MNTYNDDLNATVAQSLKSQAVDLKTVNSEANASMFALYYAEEVSISAEVQAAKAKVKQDEAEARKKQAVDNSNISINLLNSVNQTNQYMQKSVVNTAVAASNVQLAAKAIVKLASDIGSIYNIVQAADFHSDISEPVEIANELITRSAYAAEYASQIAMETSILTSQVPAATLLEKAKSTNSAMNDLLKTLKADYDAKSQAVVTANTVQATSRTNEKQAEGNYEDINTVCQATDAAYKATNDGLNLGLEVTVDEKNSSTNFTLQFNLIKGPFDEPELSDPNPVKEYYAFVVKRKQKSTFSISAAEAIIQNKQNPEKCISLNRYISKSTDTDTTDVQHPVALMMPFKQTFNYLSIPGTGNTKYILQDSDGDLIATGAHYSVFILAVYKDEYKRYLNTYDDLLSSPSQTFCLTHQLAVAKLPMDISALGGVPTDPNAQKISFTVVENPDYAGQVEYRCMLLPSAKKSTFMGQANVDTLKELDDEIAALNKIADKMDPVIAEFHADILAAESQIEAQTSKNNYMSHVASLVVVFQKDKLLTKDLSSQEKIEKAVKLAFHLLKKKHTELKKSKLDIKKQPADFLQWIEKNSKETEEFLAVLFGKIATQQEMNRVKQEKAAIVAQINEQARSKIDFLFNLTLAEQVPAGNYLHAHKPKTADEGSEKKGKTKVPVKQITDASIKLKAQPQEWEVHVRADATDNFGNPLVKDTWYIPVIVSVSTAEEENLSKFTNTWTGYNHSRHLKAKY